MLTRQENEIMKIVYESCAGKDSCLISPSEILEKLPEKSGIDEKRAAKILKSLELDDYFDIIYSDRKGEQIYCITLHTKGAAYKRSNIRQKRQLFMRVGLTVGFAVLSFVVGLILKSIFT